MTVAISGQQIDKLAPRALAAYRQAFTAPEAAKVLEDHGVSNSALRVCHFLAQVMTETGALTLHQENLSYSAQRLVQVWPRHFPSLEAAAPYAHNPEKLGDFIYGHGSIAHDLGNTEPADGYKYRGRGLLQITGRNAYARYGKALGIDLLGDPDLAFGTAALAVTCAEWAASGYHGKTCNQLADADDVLGVTHAINGGTNGLADRRLWLKKAKEIWMSAAEAHAATPTPPPASRATANQTAAAG